MREVGTGESGETRENRTRILRENVVCPFPSHGETIVLRPLLVVVRGCPTVWSLRCAAPTFAVLVQTMLGHVAS